MKPYKFSDLCQRSECSCVPKYYSCCSQDIDNEGSEVYLSHTTEDL